MHTELRKVVSRKKDILVDGTLHTGFFASGLEYSFAELITVALVGGTKRVWDPLGFKEVRNSKNHSLLFECSRVGIDPWTSKIVKCLFSNMSTPIRFAVVSRVEARPHRKGWSPHCGLPEGSIGL